MLFTIKKAISFKPTIIICQYPPVAVPLIARICAQLTRAKFIPNASDLWSFALSGLAVSNKKSLFSKWVGKYEKWLFRKSDLILVQSEETKEFLETQFPNKTNLYRTGVDCQLFRQKKNYNLNEKLKIVYVGVLGMAHGVLDVCENINFQSLNAEFHIFGDGFERSQIEKYVHKNPQSSIFLHQSVKNSGSSPNFSPT